MTLGEVLLLARVEERAGRLFHDGYRATIREDLNVEVTNPHGVTYTIVPLTGACTCGFRNDWLCKHAMGYEKLLADQQEAGLPDTPFGPCMKFPLGQLCSTPGAARALQQCNQPVLPLFRRHAMGDWGAVDDEDKQANDSDLKHGGRLLSCYHLSDDTRVWVITEWDRSATTLLLPEEY